MACGITWMWALTVGLVLAGAHAQAQLSAFRQALSPSAVLLDVGQEATDFANGTELPLANYLRRGVDPVFEPSMPALYLAVGNEQDVLVGCKYALDNKLKLALRGQGHHQAGVAFLPGGLTLDLSPLKDVQVDPNTASVRFEAGLSGLELAEAVSQYGLHYRVAHASSNGIAGFTLGGGVGWGGLAIDQITGFDVVSTWLYPAQELSIVRVNETSYSDLYSALQGAGQMTGAVVAFYAELQQLPPEGLIRAIHTVWPLASANKAWDTWNSFNGSHSVDPAVEITVAYATLPGLGPVAVVALWDWSTENTTSTQGFIDAWLDTARAAGAAITDMPTPYKDVLGTFDLTQQYPGVTAYSQSLFVEEMSPDIIAVLNAGYAIATTPLCVIINDYLDLTGKANEDTAWGWRGKHLIIIWAFWSRTSGGAQVDGDAEHIAWVDGIAASLEQYKLGQYINFQSFEHANDTQLSVTPENWPAVVAAKARYDPHNLLRELDFYHSGNDGTGGLDATNPSSS